MDFISIALIMFGYASAFILFCVVVHYTLDLVAYIVYRVKEKRYIEHMVEVEMQDLRTYNADVERYIRREAGRDFRRMYKYERL